MSATATQQHSHGPCCPWWVPGTALTVAALAGPAGPGALARRPCAIHYTGLDTVDADLVWIWLVTDGGEGSVTGALGCLYPNRHPCTLGQLYSGCHTPCPNMLSTKPSLTPGPKEFESSSLLPS